MPAVAALSFATRYQTCRQHSSNSRTRLFDANRRIGNIGKALAAVVLLSAVLQTPSYSLCRSDVSVGTVMQQDLPVAQNETTPPQATPPERTETGNEREQPEKTELDRELVRWTANLARFTGWLAFATIATAIATLFVFVATALLAYFALVQSRDMKNSIEITRRYATAAELAVEQMAAATERKLCAYVYIKDFDVKLVSDMGGLLKPTIYFFWENTGLTPTRDLVTSINWQEFANEIPADFSFPEGRKIKALIGPKQHIEVRTADILIEAYERAALGQSKIYVWGSAEYRDVFRDNLRHVTEFCVHLIVRGNPRSAECFFATGHHDAHNGSRSYDVSPQAHQAETI